MQLWSGQYSHFQKLDKSNSTQGSGKDSKDEPENMAPPALKGH